MKSKYRSLNTNRQSKKKYIRFDHELLGQIELSKSSTMSFSEWVKTACREKLVRDQDAAILSTPKNSRLNINEPSQNGETLELIVKLHQQGLFYQQIADALNQRQRLTEKGERWTRLAVRRVLFP